MFLTVELHLPGFGGQVIPYLLVPENLLGVHYASYSLPLSVGSTLNLMFSSLTLDNILTIDMDGKLKAFGTDNFLKTDFKVKHIIFMDIFFLDIMQKV